MVYYPDWIFIYANSDLLYWPVVFADVFHRGGHLNHWYYPPAPYFFPDFLTFSIAFAIGQNAFQQVIVFALLQAILFYGAMIWLFRVLGVRIASGLSAGLVGLTVLLALANLQPYQHLVMSGYHFGSFLVLLASLALVLKMTKSDLRSCKRSLALLAALAAATTWSDGLVLFQLIVPLVATLAFMGVIGAQPWPKMIVIAITLALAGGIGLIAQLFLIAHHMSYPAVVNLSHLGNKFADFAALLSATPVISTFLCLCFLICTCRCVFIAVARRGQALDQLDVLLVFAVCSAVMSLIVPLVFDGVLVVARYLISFYLLPFTLAPAAICRGGRVLGARVVLAATAACGLVVALQGGALAWGHRLHSTYYPADVACVDKTLSEHGYRFGIAGYWDAKYIEGLSRTGLAPAQYAPGPTEYRWITTSDYYLSAYDYAIVSDRDNPDLRLSESLIESINGNPDLDVDCGDLTVLGYDGTRMKVAPPE